MKTTSNQFPAATLTSNDTMAEDTISNINVIQTRVNCIFSVGFEYKISILQHDEEVWTNAIALDYLYNEIESDFASLEDNKIEGTVYKGYFDLMTKQLVSEQVLSRFR